MVIVCEWSSRQLTTQFNLVLDFMLQDTEATMLRRWMVVLSFFWSRGPAELEAFFYYLNFPKLRMRNFTAPLSTAKIVCSLFWNVTISTEKAELKC